MKQLEQNDNELLYTYVRDNEQKVKYNSTYSHAQQSGIASNLRQYQSISIASHASFFSSPLLSSLTRRSSSLSPASLQHGTRTLDTHLSTSVENIRKHRLQLTPSPPPPPLPIESIRGQTSSRIDENTDNSTELLDLLDGDVDLSSHCKRTTSKSSANMNLGSQQPVLIVNSLQTLHSLTKRLVITFPHQKTTLNLVGQSSLPKSSKSRSSFPINE